MQITPATMKEAEAAAFLGLSLHTLRKWRSQNRGPRYLKMAGAERPGRGAAGSVRYRRSDLENFLEASVVETDAR